MEFTVGEVARLAGISPRTLRHYDRIGLLSPARRSRGGYRLYGDDDLVTLQQVLFFRELGFPLRDISRIMHDRSFDRLDALRLQRKMLKDRVAQLDRMITAVDRAIDGLEKGTTMDRSRLFEAFGDFDPSRYEEEVRKRWGQTDPYQESARRTARYTREDWQAVKEEGDRINEEMARLLEEGVQPVDPRATDVAERHRLMIDRWFYPCSHAMHVGLGRMYVSDPRFAETYEKVRIGLARFLCEAIQANAERHADQGGSRED